MADRDRFSKLKVYKYTPSGMAFLFVLLFAGVGGYVISQSKAGTMSYAKFYDQGSVVAETGVSQISDSVNSAGTQTVNQVSTGSKLIYASVNQSKYKSICYYVRAVSGPGTGKTATVEFVGQGNSKTVSFPVSDSYQSYCIKSSHKSQKSYSLYNNSGPNGPDVNVYLAITSS